MLNRLVCRCAEKIVSMVNEFAGFGDLNYFFFIILSKLTIKCVIGCEWICENCRGPMETVERDHYLLSMFNKIGLCVLCLKIFFRPRGLAFGGLKMLFP